MPTINAGKYGTLQSASNSSWSGVRDATTADGTISNQPTSTTGTTARISYLSVVSKEQDYTLMGFIESYKNITEQLTSKFKI